MKLRALRMLAPALLASIAGAQLPTSQPLAISAAPARVAGGATVLAVEDGNQLHVFSSITRRWTSQALAAPTSRFAIHDDHVVAQDGRTLLGCASRRGAFASVTGASPILVTAPPQAQVSIAIDGNLVHCFSAFTGTWSTATFAGTPFVAVDRLAALASDGSQTFAFGAHFGTFVPLGTAGVTAVEAAGYGGYASSPSAAHLFSAPQNTWTTLPIGPLTRLRQPTSRAAMLILEDPASFRFFSLMNGAVQTVARSGLDALTFTDHAAIVVDGNVATGFSPSTGRIVTQAVTSPIQVLSASAYHLLFWDYANTLHAWSGVLGAFASVQPRSLGTRVVAHASSAAAYMATVDTIDAFYSAFTNRWTAAPAVRSGLVTLTNAGAVLRDPAGGMYGFSALHGTLTFLPGAFTTRVFSAGGTFAAVTGNRVDVFNAELPAWSTQIFAGPPGVLVDTSSVVVASGNDVDFYGARDDRWTHLSFAAPPNVLGHGDELGFVQTATQMIGIGGSGQTGSLSNAPESWRVHARSGRAALHVAGEPGAAAALLVGTLGANLVLPGIGTLLVDPASAALIPFASLPASGTQALAIDVPATAALAGAMIHMQAAILPASGLAYLTNVHRSLVF